MKDIVKVSVKVVLGLFTLGVGAKLTQDAITQAKQIKTNKNK